MTFGLSGAALSAVAVGGTTLVSGLAQADSAKSAAGAQSDAANAGIAETRRQFDKVQELLKPYADAGAGAIGQQEALLGLAGPEAQQAAISAIEGGSQFQTLAKQGEDAILQNAAATGGVRGGNVQGALAEFRPTLLNDLISQQFGRLGSVVEPGQASAAGVGSAATGSGANIATLLGEAGAAQAGGGLGVAAGISQIPTAITSGLGLYKGLGGEF